MKKEYGGYLPLELAQGTELYSDKNFIAVDKGRSAILLAILEGNYTKVYIPYYTCPTIAEFIKRESSVQIVYYNIDEQFMPINVTLEKNACILWTNYFGIIEKKVISKLVDLYSEALIVDSTQSFFLYPFGRAAFVYSCRKFFGVSDGGYLWFPGKETHELPIASSLEASRLLLSAYENGTNASYEEYLNNEHVVSDKGIWGMSNITHRIMQSIDYQKIREIRTENFIYLHSRLKEVNELTIYEQEIDAPQVYPLLVKRECLRTHLIENKIYVPQWWKCILRMEETKAFERYLAEYLIPLPIDQRYSVEDMQYLVNIIEEVL